MKGLLLLLAMALLGADADCDGREDGPPMRLLLPGGYTPNGLDPPAYWQDPRTGLCFATGPHNTSWTVTVVLVPCGVVEGARAKARRERGAS